MSITARDRKVLMALIPIVVVIVYWFFLLAPKRDEVSKVDKQVTEQRTAYDGAQAKLTQLKASQGDFATEYASVVRLGKAVPASLDMPSLLVQIDSAAKGTGIKFERIAAGQRTGAAPATPQQGQNGSGGTQPPAAPGSGQNTPAAAGGQPAQTGPGKTAESAGNAVNQQNASSAQSGELDTTTSQSSRSGGLPVGGGASPQTAGGPEGSGVPGLDAVSLDMEFSGGFFALSDFLHRMKRFVRVNNNQIKVSGRLITIDGFTLKLAGTGGKLLSTMRATVYLVPKAEGVTAGATPQGPAGSTPAAAGTAPSSSQPTPSGGGATTPPAATVTP